MQVVYTKKALTDLSVILEFIAEDNPTAARQLQESMLRTLSKLDDNPRLGRPGRVEHTRELVLHSSYIAAYRLTKSSVEILTIQHTARLWPNEL